MKKLLLVLLAFGGLVSTLFAADSTLVRITFIRPYHPASGASRLKFTMNDSMPVYMINHSFNTLQVATGTYMIKEGKKSKGALKLTTRSGQSYYVGVFIRNGYWEFVEVDSANALLALQNKKIKNMQKPLIRPANRIGIALDMGGGFDDIPVGKTTKDDDITFSYGGGFGIGLNYGLELSKYFDFAIGFGWHESSLTPSVDNASMTFSRLNANATGSLIIPIQGGYTQRIRLGVGLNYNFNNVYAFDLSNIQNGGGVKDTWKYNDALGMHASWIYEINTTENVSWNIGLKYQYVNYDFKSGTHYQPMTDRLGKPNGQGLFFTFGISYHF